MTELLTESFCERCGTRYTFQTAAPKQGRLTRLRVMSKGLRRYVLDDETSLEDAFADARSEEDRAISSHQLEAFHQTFNFCMSCRQYTCANCWNTAESRCLTCAPDLSREIMPAPFPETTQPTAAGLVPEAWPEVDLPSEQALTELAGDAPGPESVEDVSRDRLAAVLGLSAAAVAPTDAIRSPDPVSSAEAGSGAAAEAAPLGASELGASWDEVLGADGVATADALVGDGSEATGSVVETAASVEAEPIFEVEAPGEEAAAAAAAAEPGAADAEAMASSPDGTDERAIAAAAATAALLGRFRPGQNLDDVIDAYDHEHPDASDAARIGPSVQEDAIPTPEPVGAAPLDDAAAELVAAELTSLQTGAGDASVAGTTEPATDEAEAGEALAPEIAAAEAPQPPAPGEPTPTQVPAAQDQPVTPAERRDDRVEMPVWTIVAPESEAPTTPPLPAIQPQPRAMPQWPTLQADATPQWPTDPFTASAAAARAQDVLWAASVAEVSQKAVAVRSCGSCGLSLSATARFCRRCGSRQD